MHYLYIDESGDYNDYLDPHYTVIPNRSKFFTLGGIIVDEDGKKTLELYFDYIMSKFFNGIRLPANFKLHYNKLRQCTFPYDKLNEDKRILTDEIFNQIINIDCKLVSVTIDKEKHCKRYTNPVNPLGYGLYIMLERFQYFLQDHNDEGVVIYERYNSNMRKLVERAQKWLITLAAFPTPINLDKIAKKVINGDPKNEPILQYADFVTYAPWIRSTSEGKCTKRYDRIKHKYYNLDHNSSFKRGNVEI